MKISKIVIILIALAAFFAACTQTQPSNMDVKANKPNVATNAMPTATVDELAAGRQLYADNCAICHKDTGAGGKVTVDGKTIDPASLTSASMKKHSDEKLFSHVSDGVPDEGMPAFKGKLTEAQIKDVVSYVRHGLQKM